MANIEKPVSIKNSSFGKSNVLCVVTRAFDCVPRELLLVKLEHNDVGSLPLFFVKSYLMDRSQYIIINNNVSEFKISMVYHMDPF